MSGRRRPGRSEAVGGSARAASAGGIRAPLAAGGTAEGAVAPAVPTEVAALLDDDEVVLLLVQPSPWLIPLSALGSLVAIAFVALLMAWASRFPIVPWTDVQVFALGAVIAAGRLVFQAADWSQRLYALTDRRVLKRSGLLRPSVEQLILPQVRHAVVLAAPRERFLGVGSVMFATAVGVFGQSWEAVRRPQQVVAVVREALERYRH